jgi:hypothetical protein
MKTLADPKHILQTVFGYDAFRHNQKEIIEEVLNGKDAVVLMPYGWRQKFVLPGSGSVFARRYHCCQSVNCLNERPG